MTPKADIPVLLFDHLLIILILTSVRVHREIQAVLHDVVKPTVQTATKKKKHDLQKYDSFNTSIR